MRIFEALFNGSWPKLSTHALEKCFENPHFIFCSSFQNLRLGSIKWSFRLKSRPCLSNEDFERQNKTRNVILPQTKILERRTKEMRILEALFNGVSTRFGPRTIEQSIRKFAFHLLFLLPQTSFGEHKCAHYECGKISHGRKDSIKRPSVDLCTMMRDLLV